MDEQTQVMRRQHIAATGGFGEGEPCGVCGSTRLWFENRCYGHPDFTLDELVGRIVGLRDTYTSGLAARLGATMWAEHLDAHPDAEPPEHAFGWWDRQAMKAKAYEFCGWHGNRGSGSWMAAKRRWVDRPAFEAAQEAYARETGDGDR